MRSSVHAAWIRITADKRRAMTLVVLLAVLGVLGGRALLDAGPSSVHGAPGSIEASTVQEQLGERFARTLQTIESGKRGPIIELATAGRLERNLFRLDEAVFPEPAQPEQADDQPPKPVAAPDESVDVTPEVGLRERILAEADRFRLRSTLVGTTPIAVIEVLDGRGTRRVVLSPGQGTEGFVVREVRSNTAILEKQGVRVELRRQLPEG